MIIMFGALAYGLLQIISQILIAMRITYSQTIIIFISSIMSLILSILLIFKYGIMGASISYMIVMIFAFILFITVLCCSLIKRSKQ